MRPTYFADAKAFRDWLRENHAAADELWMGLYKKGSGRPSITWSEAVDEALCYGWIDGIRKSIDDRRYMNRFTPRKPNSNWSDVNIRRVEELIRQRRMRAAGMRAFEARTEREPGALSYERRHEVELPLAFERAFRASKDAWAWFKAQPRGYRSMTLYWVMSAKRPETQERRLARLIEGSEKGERVGPLARPAPES